MLRLLIAVLSTVSSFSIRDEAGRPVQGAAVRDTTGMAVAFSDSAGLVHTDFAGAVSVTALGYAEWLGRVGSGGTIVLEPSPIPSGLVVPVRAARPSLRDRVPSTTVLGPDELHRISAGGLSSVSCDAPGVIVREYGGALPVISVSVRGSDPSQTGWLVDGHSMTGPSDGLPAGLLDPSLFGAMEISRGANPGIAGAGLAATVNLVPEPAGARPSLGLLTDDRGGYRLLLSTGLAGLARLGALRAHRVGDASTVAEETGLLCTLSPGPFTGGLLAGASEGGVEPPDWSPPTDAVRATRSVDLWAGSRPGLVSVRCGLHLGGMDYESTLPDTVDSRMRDGRADAGLSAALAAEGLRVRTDISLTREWASGSLGEEGSRDRIAFSAVSDIGRSPVILADISADACRGEAGMLSCRMGASVPLLDSAIVVGASIGRSCRRPTFNELYWPGDEFAEGNDALGPEKSLEGEMDLSCSRGPFGASLSLFAGRIEDLILWAPGTGGIWRPDNIGLVAKRGLEAACRVSTRHLEAAGTLSLLSMTDEVAGSTEGMQLPYRPAVSWGGHFRVSARRASAVLEARGSGPRFINAANTALLDPFAVLDGSIAVVLASDVTLSVGGANIFDEAYEESNGFPGRGRRFQIGIEVRGEAR